MRLGLDAVIRRVAVRHAQKSVVCLLLPSNNRKLGVASDVMQVRRSTASVVSSSDAIDAAFCSAERTTLVGSMTPALTRFS